MALRKIINIVLEEAYGHIRDSSGCPRAKMMDFRR